MLALLWSKARWPLQGLSNMALRDRPLVQAIVNKFTENRPLVAAIVEGAQRVAERQNTKITKADVPAVTEAVVEAMASDPRVVNSMNGEPLRASRTFMASAATALTGLSSVLVLLGPALDAFAREDTGTGWSLAIAALLGTGATGSGVFGMIGRAVKGLPPMHFKWWNPLSWLAPRETHSTPTGD